jgi:N-acetylmuramoyl-L-alanine amidase
MGQSMVLRRRVGFFSYITGVKKPVALKCLLPAFFLWMAVGCAENNGVLRRLPSPPLRTGTGHPRVVAPQPMVVIPPVETPTPAPVQPQYPTGSGTVVIDPGHGGKDSGTLGCSSATMSEKEINIVIALEVARNLRSRGFNVIMTRSDDRFIELDERAGISNRAGADLFVAIHIDASSNHGATGSTVYISRSPGSRSVSAAESVRAALMSGGVKCNGVKHAGYRVLVRNDRPCMLVECGYLSNPWEARRLCDSGYQSQIASCIAQGIAESLGR